jgi:hypothetical protein
MVAIYGIIITLALTSLLYASMDLFYGAAALAIFVVFIDWIKNVD